MGRPRIKFNSYPDDDTRAEIHGLVQRRIKNKGMREGFFKGKDKTILADMDKEQKEVAFWYAMVMGSAYEMGRKHGQEDLGSMIDEMIDKTVDSVAKSRKKDAETG